MLDKKSGCIFNEVITSDKKDIIFMIILIHLQIQNILKITGNDMQLILKKNINLKEKY